MDRQPECPVCRSGERVRPMLRKNSCELYRCATCDHIFVSPHPDEEQIAALYSFDSGYQVQGMQRFEEMRSFPPKFHRSLDQIRRRIPGGKLLDVGCSTGMFVYLAKQAGFEAHGVELNKDTAAIARANGLDVTIGTLDDATLPRASFDAIHMGDLIEHVPRPEDVLCQARALLRSGGALLVLTPNHDAFFPRATYRLFRMFGIPWSHPAPPLHLNQFSRKSLAALVEREGFSVTEEFYAPCELLYEMRATGAFSQLKRSVRQRKPASAALAALACFGVVASYPLVWIVDRLLPGKRQDFAMTFLLTPIEPDPGRR